MDRDSDSPNWAWLESRPSNRVRKRRMARPESDPSPRLTRETEACSLVAGKDTMGLLDDVSGRSLLSDFFMISRDDYFDSKSFINEVNMTTCFMHRRRFFQKYESVDCNLLIAYWMMAGYLDPFQSFQEGYEKGYNILMELTHNKGILKFLPSGNVTYSNNHDHCSHRGLCTMANPGLVDLLDLDQLEKLAFANGMLKDEKGSFLLLDGVHPREVFSPCTESLKLRYIACFNPTPNLIEFVLENVDNPSVLLLRGCRQLSKIDFSFEKLATLTALEISGLGSLTDTPKAIFSQLIQLQCLTLCDLPIRELSDGCFSKLQQLRLLTVSWCYGLTTLAPIKDLSNLVALDVSGCKQLTSLPDLSNLTKMEVLHVSHCYRLTSLPDLSRLTKLEVLDVSDCEQLTSLPDVSNLTKLKALDISRCYRHTGLPDLNNLTKLEVLHVSHCYRLTRLPDLSNLTKLKVIDVSGCDQLTSLPDLSDLTKVEVTGVSETEIKPPYSFAYPDLVETDPSGVQELNANNANQLLGFDRIKQSAQFDKLLDLISAIQSAFKSTAAATNSDNDAYKRQVEMLKMDVEFIKNHIESLKSSPNRNRVDELLQHLMDAADQSKDDFAHDSSNLTQLIHTVAKLKLWVPRQQASGLESSAITKKGKESSYTSNKKEKVAAEIVEALVNLEIPQWRTTGLLRSYESLTVNQKLCLLCFSVFPCNVDKDNNTGVLVWKSLVIKKKILIYWWVGEGFIDLHYEENVETEASEQVSPAHMGKKKKTVEEIGEQVLKVFTDKGFIEPVIEKGWETGRCRMHPLVHSFVIEQAKRYRFFDFSDENGKLTMSFTRSRRACLLKSQDSSLSSCQLFAKYTRSRERLKRFKTVRTLFNVNEAIITIQPEWFLKMKDLSVLHLGSWKSETGELIEVANQNFMEDLKNMKQLRLFSLQGMSTIMKLPDSVCKLTNLIILDLRECHNLEELPADIGSLKNLTHLDITNCHLVTKMPKGISLLSKLELLKGFVICDRRGDPQDKKVYILNHWWKKTKRCMIHGLLRYKNKEICTLRDLLKLKKLREFSIVVNNDSFPHIEELKVFKEMESLCKLKISWERGFEGDKKNDSSGQTEANQGDNESPEEDQGDNESPEEDLGNNDTPEEDEGNNNAPESTNLSAKEAQNAIGQEALTTHKCLELMKCCKLQSSQKDGKRKSIREFLDQIEKLELWCFPHETAPDWLVPNQMKNLQKLYIRGGKLKKLPGGTDGNKWEVTTLRLKYLSNLVMTWTELKVKFPNLTYLEQYECRKSFLLPCDEEDVWKKEI